MCPKLSIDFLLIDYSINRLQQHFTTSYIFSYIKILSQTSPPSLFLIIADLLPGDKCCFSRASTGSELQTAPCTGSQGYKINTRGLHVCLCVCACCDLWIIVARRGVGGCVGEWGSESVRIAWWRTDPAVTTAYK